MSTILGSPDYDGLTASGAGAGLASDLSGVISLSGVKGWVYDPTRDQIDLVTSDGTLRGWSIPNRQFDFALSIGGTPGAIDITPDGHYLLASNTLLVVTSDTPRAALDTVTRIDLATHAVDQLQFKLGLDEGGIDGIAVGGEGSAYFPGAGSKALHQFFASAASPALATIPTPAPANLSHASYLIPSEDHRYILFEAQGSSDGPLLVYDTSAAAFVGSTNLYAINASGFQVGAGDISSAAGRVVDVLYGNVFVFDLSLQKVADLSSFTSAGGVVGGAFNEGGHQLFLWQGPNNKIVVIDTLSWRQVGSLDVATAAAFDGGDAPHRMDVVSNGRVLALGGGSGVELIDLSARLHLSINGDGGNQLIYGAVGADTLDAGAGQDTLVGGGGTDVLSGGAGADLFLFQPGDSAATQGASDRITDWDAADTISFCGPAGTSSNYSEATASTFADAQALANQRIGSGQSEYVAVAVGGDVVLFADSRHDDGVADDAVVLNGRSLADINFSAITNASPPPPPTAPPPLSPPPPPPPPQDHTQGLSGVVSGNMDAAHLSDLLSAVLTDASSTRLAASRQGGSGFILSGQGFDYENNQLVGGAATHLSLTDVNSAGVQVLQLDLGMPSISVASFENWLAYDQTQAAFGTIFAGDDVLQGGAGSDLIRSFTGNDSVSGGAGNDTLIDSFGSNFLTGGDGDDSIQGGAGFDRTNGNAGNDTVHGNAGDDWVTGGRDNDLLYGDDGNDILNGNLGDDAEYGGLGNDVVRGGQGNDLLSGGAGDDYLTGDLGNDTMTGGSGADTFRAFASGGDDRITDFNAAEGDHIQLDPGTTYTAAQVGADAVLTFAGGGSLTLAGVTLSALPPGWIVGG